MTLLGMALAVGVVIDDAIIVLENIERHREAGEDAARGRVDGTREIAFAATAATFSVAAVFLPVVFVEGMVGSFLGEFGLTVAGSVLISLFVALTLTPMLAARMPPPKERAHGSIYHWLERGFAVARDELPARARLDARAPRRARSRIALALVRRGDRASARGSSAEFFPPADEGMFFARIETPPGTSLEATLEYLRARRGVVPGAARGGRAVLRRSATAGPDGVGRTNEGMMFAHAGAARRARAHGAGDHARRARSARRRSPARRSASSTRRDDARRLARGRRSRSSCAGNLPLAELDRCADRDHRAARARAAASSTSTAA